MIKIDDLALSYLENIIEENFNSSLADSLFNEYLGLDNKNRQIQVKKNKLTFTDFALNLRNKLCLKEEHEYFDKNLMKYFYSLKELSPKEFINNDYYAFLNSIPTSGKIENGIYLPNEVFQYDEKVVKQADFYGDFTQFAYFKAPFTFKRLSKDDTTWMSIIPHEIKTFENPIKLAKGDVLTFGLGLGYFAFMASKKENVNKIDVIEFDEEIISWFKENIYPYIPHKGKINIIKGDALKYDFVSHYDYLFIDIYHNEADGLPLYLDLIKKIKNIDSCDFWIEKTLLIYLKRFLVTSLEEMFIETDYINIEEDNFESKLISSIKTFIYNKYKIINKEHLDSLLSFEGLKELAKSI